MVTGPSKTVAMALGMVPMSRCIEAYIRLIEDDSLDGMYILTIIIAFYFLLNSTNNNIKKCTIYLVGDVVVVTSEKTYIEQRYPDSTSEKLDQLCSDRKHQYREQINEQLRR